MYDVATADFVELYNIIRTYRYLFYPNIAQIIKRHNIIVSGHVLCGVSYI